jgi:two-component system, NarL family, sensor kinase
MTPFLADIRSLITVGVVYMLLLVVSFLVIIIISLRRRSKLQKEMSYMKELQQNQLIEAAVKSEEGERHRIAETLHDEVGAILSSVRLHFSNIKLAQMDERGNKLHDKSKELLDEAIQKVRSISHNLHSTLLKEFGLNEAIRNFLTKTVQGNIMHVDMELDPNYMIQSPQMDISIYRILQELTNNILKHAHPTHISVSTSVHNNFFTLSIQFDGSGLSQEQFEELRYKPEGLGLKNIQNRIILLKGNIYFEKNNPENTIRLTVPLNPES